MSPSEDIRSVPDLKRKTREILDHLHAAGRPVILTVNGKDDSVLLDVRVYEKYLQPGNLAKLIAPTEQDLESGLTRAARGFLEVFKVYPAPGRADQNLVAGGLPPYEVAASVAHRGPAVHDGSFEPWCTPLHVNRGDHEDPCIICNGLHKLPARAVRVRGTGHTRRP